MSEQGPLRKVVRERQRAWGRVMIRGRECKVGEMTNDLECGHSITWSATDYKEAKRRRCTECLKETS